MFDKRILVFLFALLITGPFSTTPADAAQYPKQPITLIVPFVAGAGTDTNARIISKYAPKYLGVPVVVLNRPGAAGAIGYTQLSQAKPDGYTIGYTNLPNMIQLVVDGNVKFKIGDFKPIIGQVKESKVITVIQKSPFKTIEELVEFAKQNPGKLLAASNGPGSHNESVLNAFSAKAGIKMIMIPYKGDGAMKVAMLGQEAQVMSIGTSGLDLVQFRPLMLFDTARDPHMPNVPTTFEKGFNLDMSSSRVLQAPMGAPPEALLYLESQLKKMFNDPEYLEDMNKGGGGAKMLTSDEVTKLILREKEFYSVNK